MSPEADSEVLPEGSREVVGQLEKLTVFASIWKAGRGSVGGTEGGLHFLKHMAFKFSSAWAHKYFCTLCTPSGKFCIFTPASSSSAENVPFPDRRSISALNRKKY